MNLKFDFTVGFVKPPVATNLYTFNNINIDAVRKIKLSIHETIEKLKDDKEILTEAEILRKIHYKFKNQWRREKTLKTIKQVHTVWTKFKSINLNDLLMELKDLLPNRNLGQETIHLPSFRLVCYNLCIILRACALLKATSNLCVVGCRHAHQQINGYLFAHYMTICYAALSKFCFLCKNLLDILSDCYHNIRGLSEVLNVPSSLLKGFNILPQNAKSWLEHDLVFPHQIFSLFSIESKSEDHSVPSSGATTCIGKSNLDAPPLPFSGESIQSSLSSSIDSSMKLPNNAIVDKFHESTVTKVELLDDVGGVMLSDDDHDGDDDKNNASDDDDGDNDDSMSGGLHSNVGDEMMIPKKAKIEGDDGYIEDDHSTTVVAEKAEGTLNDVENCSTIGQLLNLVKAVKASNDKKLKGFKLCSKKLRVLKEEMKLLNESKGVAGKSSDFQKRKRLLIKKSKTVARKFFAKISRS